MQCPLVANTNARRSIWKLSTSTREVQSKKITDLNLVANESSLLQLDHDVCSNYGNDPRENRKFNIIKQGTDYDHDGDFVRLWVPELSRIEGLSNCLI